MDVIGTPDFNYLDGWVNTFGNIVYVDAIIDWQVFELCPTDCHIRLHGLWSPFIAGEHNALCRLKGILQLSSRLIIKSCNSFSGEIFSALYFIPWFQCWWNLAYTFIFDYPVWGEVLENKPNDWLHNTGNPWGQEREPCFKHCIYSCRLIYKVSISHFLNEEVRVWWRCKWLCMFMVLPVYFTFTIHFLYIVHFVLIASLLILFFLLNMASLHVIFWTVLINCLSPWNLPLQPINYP